MNKRCFLPVDSVFFVRKSRCLSRETPQRDDFRLLALFLHKKMLECILPLYVRNLREKGRDDMGRMCFELPVEGASGYAVVETELRVEPVLTGEIL